MVTDEHEPSPPVLPARGEPWFVGRGNGLKFVVLGLCAVLMLACVGMVATLTAAWWRELNQPERTTAQRPAPTRRVPPTDPGRANARLAGNVARFFGPESYPVEAIRHGEQGRVSARLLVDRTGTPVRCDITTSSGFDSLDQATCNIVLRRVRFEPARDDKGRPISSPYLLAVRWALPDE